MTLTLTRRAALAGTAAALPLFSIGTARAAEFSMRFANNLPAVHPLNTRANEATARIAERTGGRVDISIYPNSQLGSDTDVFGKLRQGDVEFFTLSGLILASLVPAAAINGVGFAFENADKVWAAMDGGLGAYVRTEIMKRGLVPVGRIWNNGYRQVTTSTRAVATPDDLHGLRMRVPVGDLWTSMFSAFGATPANINFNEVHQALQSGTADGQENPLALIRAAKLYEVQSFCSLTYHMWDGFWLLTSEAVWRRLPQAMRDIVEAEFDRAALDERRDTPATDPLARADLAAAGMTLTPVDTKAFRTTLKRSGFYAEWRRKFGEPAWDILEGYANGLA